MLKGVMDPDLPSGMASIFDPINVGGVSGKLRLASGWPGTNSILGRTKSVFNVPLVHSNRPFKGMASGN